ncbi:MAG TPA: DUF4258 domain-containing protein [Polyangiaceae bacterium]|nr:DUF4258 domain-containing protein [Polyangiaceae bacterium]
MRRRGRFVISAHAHQRMRQRNTSLQDVRSALTGAQRCEADDLKWKVTGPDGDGDALTCVVVLEGTLVVVTVF